MQDEGEVLYQLKPQVIQGWKKASLQNISGGGVGIRLREPVYKGEFILVKFFIPFDRGEIVTTGEVVWFQTDSPNEYAAGVEFKNLDEHLRGKIIRHVFSVQRKIAFSKRRLG